MLASWLLRAAVCRYLLAAFLSHRRRLDVGTLDRFLAEDGYTRTLRRMGLTGAGILRRCLWELAHGRFASGSPTFADVRALYEALTPGARPASLADVHRCDPIARLTAYDGMGSTPEMRFVADGLRYLRELAQRSRDDGTFTKLFWQTLRVRTMVYRHVVQRPMTPGLQWFVRTYRRLKPFRQALSTSIMVESAANVCGVGRGLRSLELRTAPDGRIADMLKLVRDTEKGVQRIRGRPDASDLEVGVVLHFTKSRGRDTFDGIPSAHWIDSEARPSGTRNLAGYRYADFYCQRRVEALAFAGVLLRFPHVLSMIRGVDVCTDELGVPTWVMVPLLRYVREASAIASAYLDRAGLAIPALRTTVHAGEDFVHLLGGLRRIDEAIRCFKLRAGDRLGHGVALGVDPRAWAANAGPIPMLVEERLLDLSWEWSWWTRTSQGAATDRLALLQREIARLSTQLFGSELSPYAMECLVADLHTERTLSALGFPTKPLRRDHRRPYSHMYLTSKQLFDAGRHIEWIDPATEAEALVQIQSGLRRQVGRCGLTVEVNPSSNLLIANLSDLAHHPLWRLKPPRGDGEVPPLPISVGSDDPITFATKLPEEYGLLYDTLLAAGLSDDQAQGWVDQLRRRGLETRFTLPAGVNPCRAAPVTVPRGSGSHYGAAGRLHIQPAARSFIPVHGLDAFVRPIL
jgi:hypothetical protein